MRAPLFLALASMLSIAPAHASNDLAQAMTQFDGLFQLTAESDPDHCNKSIQVEAEISNSQLIYSIATVFCHDSSHDTAHCKSYNSITFSNTDSPTTFKSQVKYGFIKNTEQPYIEISSAGWSSSNDPFCGEALAYSRDKDRYILSADGSKLTYTAVSRDWGFMTYCDTGGNHTFEHNKNVTTCEYRKVNSR